MIQVPFKSKMTNGSNKFQMFIFIKNAYNPTMSGNTW